MWSSILNALGGRSLRLPTAAEALPGRSEVSFQIPETHEVLGSSLQGPFPADTAMLWVGMGCFWGAERKFWQIPGVVSTAVGYQGGITPFPTYKEVCSGQTGHTETVQVVYRPDQVGLSELVRVFLESHDPTQGMRQGNDVGTQYRSALYLAGTADLGLVRAMVGAYGERLRKAGFGPITTEIGPAPVFYFAEAYHQQYLHKNPGGYCGLQGTGVGCPVGVGV